MAKKESKDWDGKRMTKYNGGRATIGIEELKGYYFTHGDHGSGSKFSKTVEKIADYCRVEVSKDIYKLILYGEELKKLNIYLRLPTAPSKGGGWDDATTPTSSCDGSLPIYG